MSKKPSPLVSVIVPTLNGEKLLEDFFMALSKSKFKNFEVIINDDKRSTDNTKSLVDRYSKKGMQAKYLKKNISMAQGRRSAAEHAKGEVLLHLDSDMQVAENLLGECVEKIKNGYDALVIPEDAFGTTFWAKCKAMEKKCYEGVDHIESLRCVTAKKYWEVDGHNEKMVFSEDKDLDLRVRASSAKVGRTENRLRHNEGELKLIKTMKKKSGYSQTANLFAEAHPEAYRWQGNIFKRYWLYARNARYLFSSPLVYLGMIYMKTMEYAAAAMFLVVSRFYRGESK